MKIKDKYYKETEYLLYSYKMFKISIENMKNEIKYLENEEDGMTGISYDGISTSPTHKFSSITEDTALAKSEKIDYLEHSIRRIESTLEGIDRALEGLSDIERNVIVERYIEGLQWWQVGYKVKYSERHCKRIRTDAINKLAIGLNGDKAIEK